MRDRSNVIGYLVAIQILRNGAMIYYYPRDDAFEGYGEARTVIPEDRDTLWLGHEKL